MTKISNDEHTVDQDRHTALQLLHRRILACRLCEEQGYLAMARPLVHGSSNDRIMVIGQAPGHRSVANGRSFSGPGGNVLQKWLERAGFPPGFLHAHVYLSSLTRCDPGRNPRGNGDRRPSPPEVALCRPYLDAELAILQPKVVLLVGAMAIETFLGKRKLEECIGTYHTQRDMLLLPLPHPSGVSRWLLDPSHQQLLQRALLILSEWRVLYHLDEES